MSASLYILECADGSYYVGSTRDTVERRVSEHNQGIYDGYTKARRPVVLVYSECFEQITDAIAAERQVKGWSRAKKQALISGNFERIKQLAQRRTHQRGKTPPRPSRHDASRRPQDEEVS